MFCDPYGVEIPDKRTPTCYDPYRVIKDFASMSKDNSTIFAAFFLIKDQFGN
jgi:hypothetical protein